MPNKRARTASIKALFSSLDPCCLCPRHCGAKRLGGESGVCGAGAAPKLAASTIHHGEEPPISGNRGSATFFFSHCPLSCLFCQNFPISQFGYGREISVEQLARRMLVLARRGAHNINIVTGTQYAPFLAEAIASARDMGLKIPVAWNTSGYESSRTISLLKGFVDIYLTDIKYADDETAIAISDAHDYWAISTQAAKQMLEQVGPLSVDARGIARRGVIVRHLVLPMGLAGTRKVMKFIADELGPKVHVSLMGQFFPAHRAGEIPGLDRKLTPREYAQARRAVSAAKIDNGWFQVESPPNTPYTACEIEPGQDPKGARS